MGSLQWSNLARSAAVRCCRAVPPYRSLTDAPAAAPREGGLVDDIIGQFADPLAFYRELVQNAIDAGSPDVAIELRYDAGTARVTVRDRGEGMSRDILENQLVVLFRSTKERDPHKIGKFGIGFASVLSPRPTVVVVTTTRDERRHALHLYTDLTYELFDLGAATQPGTTIEIELPRTLEQAQALVRDSHAALTRWCRHATVPIHLDAVVPGTEPIQARIDRPLALASALVQVRGTTPDGKLTVMVGLPADGRPRTSFFNHGLTLYETSEPLVGGLLVAIQDARLGHTISRDNVRRDEHYDHALAFAQLLADAQLPAAASLLIREAAEAGDLARHAAIATAIDRADVAMSATQWWWPLAAPVGERRAITLAEAPAPAQRGARGRLAGLLASMELPVLLDEGALAPILARRTGAGCEAIEATLVVVVPVALTPHDLVLVDEVRALLAATYRDPAEIELAELHGAHDGALSIAGGAAEAIAIKGEAYLLAVRIAHKNPFGWLRPRVLVLAAGHALVEAARRADDPRLAAAHLTRALLLERRLLDPRRSARLLEHALARRAPEGAR